ncbi:MAG: GxxExxY protein [bacterium]|nr:GxxExxY protein [bacterium]
MDKTSPVKRTDLIYPELSYQIVGVLYGVYNELGHGLEEKIYQKATGLGLKEAGLKYTEQVYSPLKFKGIKIAKNYFDFSVDDKIVVEIKKGDKFSRAHIQQLFTYLKSSGLKLGILAYFGPNGLHFKRIINL